MIAIFRSEKVDWLNARRTRRFIRTNYIHFGPNAFLCALSTPRLAFWSSGWRPIGYSIRAEMASVSPSGDHTAANWRRGDAYAALLGADPIAFDWEWLRRNEQYRSAWDHRPADVCNRASAARLFGLERFEDPNRPVPMARPIWAQDRNASVLTAHVADFSGPPSERVDLRLISSLVTIFIDEDEIEHLLLSDGRHFLRIDVVSGTLIGCPAPLTYLLRGLTQLHGPIVALDRLAHLVRRGRFSEMPRDQIRRQERLIAELRVADALLDGADQQTIARTLFGPSIAESRWRVVSAPYRRRVQRLVATARRKLAPAV